MAGVGRLNYEPHRTLPTVPYGPSWFSGMIEEQAKRQMSSVRDYSTCLANEDASRRGDIHACIFG